MQIWMEYDGVDKQLNVTLHPINIPKPKIPILSLKRDLSPYMYETMYVGFSSSSSSHSIMKSSHYILAWSFKMNGLTLVLVTVFGVMMLLSRKRRFVEILEDWEVQYGPHRFSYKDLFKTTKGFKEKEVLGRGGFGRVYKGVLPSSCASMNCSWFMTICLMESLDKFLYHLPHSNLNWTQRFKIVKDMASTLFYLHQQWVQVIIHRDIKPANVLIDSEMNARLGDFGLAKLCDLGNDPQTSHVAGTLGYMAPELARTGKANTSTDVYAFGSFMLEVACGRRPIEAQASPDQTFLADWITGCWDNGDILAAVDGRLEKRFVVQEAELVLKLGLLCSHPVAAARPSMSGVISYLDGVAALPDNLSSVIKTREFHVESSDELITESNYSVPPLTITESFVSDGR
ncbi:hypothetical protein V6N12_023296 [Hibiscus sabdariffa]|uniref:Protein kinase domain-containing protein n=1 Tax=Hibiscus sabdariffa TaxID=183260 RepID=A0ABR2FXV9_9ROSI